MFSGALIGAGVVFALCQARYDDLILAVFPIVVVLISNQLGRRMISKEVLGGADGLISSAFVLVWGGQVALVSVYIGIVIAGLSVGLLLIWGRLDRRATIPLVPFLTLGHGLAFPIMKWQGWL
jgi:hypothetical protein